MRAAFGRTTPWDQAQVAVAMSAVAHSRLSPRRVVGFPAWQNACGMKDVRAAACPAHAADPYTAASSSTVHACHHLCASTPQELVAGTAQGSALLWPFSKL